MCIIALVLAMLSAASVVNRYVCVSSTIKTYNLAAEWLSEWTHKHTYIDVCV